MLERIKFGNAVLRKYIESRSASAEIIHFSGNLLILPALAGRGSIVRGIPVVRLEDSESWGCSNILW
jgi:hypothetical protein